MFLGDYDMNEIELIKKAFKFLLDKGFDLTCYKNNYEYCVTYSCAKLEIVLDYDLRTHQFEVGLMNIAKRDKNAYLSIMEMDTLDEYSRNEVIKKIMTIYDNEERKWFFSKKSLNKIINIYAEFIKQNIEVLESLATINPTDEDF